MADKQPQTRVFVKEVPGGEPLRRQVTSPQAEVAALFDGFVEEGATSSSSTAKSTSSKSSGSSSSS